MNFLTRTVTATSDMSRRVVYVYTEIERWGEMHVPSFSCS